MVCGRVALHRGQAPSASHRLRYDQRPTITERDHPSRLDEGVRHREFTSGHSVRDVVKPEAQDLGMRQHDVLSLTC